MYCVQVCLEESGAIVYRSTKNIAGLPDVTDDGETITVSHGEDDYPMTAVDCNDARANRAAWRRAYAAAGVQYPEDSHADR
jgi:hypothetical protein